MSIAECELHYQDRPQFEWNQNDENEFDLTPGEQVRFVVWEHDLPEFLGFPLDNQSECLAEPNADLPENSCEELLQTDPEEAVTKFLESRIEDARVPAHWDNIASPTAQCRQLCLKIARSIFAQYGFIPFKVVASQQEAILLAYKNPRNDKTMRIEVDNDLDTVAVVSNDQKILATGVFEGQEMVPLFEAFTHE
ncbi:MAG: hypothetical protein O3C40_33075 [Planctomycetota bacterium]|nr:hypothetical protein [Planctomycetota bacterium]